MQRPVPRASLLYWFAFHPLRCLLIPHLRCLLVLFGAEYLGITFIIVYVGAIAIVFLFVIMMLNIKQSELKESLRGRMARYLPIGGIISFVSLGLLLLTLSEDSPGFSGSFGSDELRYVTQECPYVN